ncbi:uncharacterized protein LOC778488 precursor [Bombyx mori]|uniref:Bmp0909-12 n=1 Tax=Bombyx mori TaxID=7091 RepID=Q0MS57_BOMMO|nr:uncharacterized protein LOC778488 precursor [Bombyx mori]ABI14022.1 bmp0909-12 [Bombyx mori]
MKIFHLIILLFIVECNCGIIDGVLDTVKGTTGSITNGVGSMWSFGKGLVLGDHHNKRPAGDSVQTHNGIIGGIISNIHERIHSFRENIHGFFSLNKNKNESDRGFVGGMIDRVKYRVMSFKELFVGHELKPLEVFNKTQIDYVDKTRPIRDSLNKYIFGKEDKRPVSNLIDFLDAFKDRLVAIRRNITEEKHSETTDGAGMLDVRANFDNLGRAADARHLSAQAKDTFNQVQDSVNPMNKNTQSNFHNTVDKIDENFQYGYKTFNEQIDKFRGDFYMNKNNINSMNRNSQQEFRNSLSNAEKNIVEAYNAVSEATDKYGRNINGKNTNVEKGYKNVLDKEMELMEHGVKKIANANDGAMVFRD